MTSPAQHSRTAEELALQRVRTIGLCLLGAAIVLNALKAPLTRVHAYRRRIVERLDPLDPRGSGLVTALTDLLSLIDGTGAKPSK